MFSPGVRLSRRAFAFPAIIGGATVRWLNPALLLFSLMLAIPAHPQEGEGEGDGGTLVCNLTDIDLLTPAHETTWYISDSTAGLDAALLATVDCAEDVYSVSFFVQAGQSPRQALGAPDYEAPYEARLQSFFAPPAGQQLVFSAEARRGSRPDEGLRTSSTVTLANAADHDANADGLPDNPFTTLGRSDDRWVSSLTMSGQDKRVLTWMRAIRALDSEDLAREIEVELHSPENSGQTLTLTFDRGLLQSGQQGLLLVRMAPTLAALVGSEEAAQFTREPSGKLNGAAQYVAVTVLVRGSTGGMSEVSPSLLAARPIRFRLSGLTLNGTREYTLARHPAGYSEGSGQLQLIATSGAWQSIRTQQVDIAQGVITGSLVTTGVVAPYYFVDESEVCPFGFCASSGLIAQILAGLALLVLQFVPGGVGGGESPCFIATAAYGTPLAEDLAILREVRDAWLLEGVAGSAFTDIYYRLSPPVADLIARTPVLAAVTRIAIMLVIALMQHPLLALSTALGMATLRACKKRRPAPPVKARAGTPCVIPAD
jgi:hypothetical protein